MEAATPFIIFPQSLSARRAWIEIDYIAQMPSLYKSLSARRAWIEINCVAMAGRTSNVALRKESVDRNLDGRAYRCIPNSRSPQGERG